MNPNTIVTLLTDFGLADNYVGVIKGVLLQINPSLQLIDLTHQIPPQNIQMAAFQLQTAYRYFPKGTVHLAVVDPGVGSQRRAIALETPTGFFVGPDNGLFSRVITDAPVLYAIELTQPLFWRVEHPSSTFHGRDIFAAVAAHLASGIPLTEMGNTIAVESLQQLPTIDYQATPSGFTGTIQAIDRFGNLITSVPNDCISNETWLIHLSDTCFPGAETYSVVPLGDPVSVLGSHGWLELSINGGNAAQQFSAHIGDLVELKLK